MRQLANGVSQFVDCNGSFPTALRYSRDFLSGGSAMSFFVELLPFIGYELLFDTFFQFNNEVLLSPPPTSRHRGGVAFALCDGPTRFLGDDIGFTIWRALGSRNLSVIIPEGWR